MSKYEESQRWQWVLGARPARGTAGGAGGRQWQQAAARVGLDVGAPGRPALPAGGAAAAQLHQVPQGSARAAAHLPPARPFAYRRPPSLPPFLCSRHLPRQTACYLIAIVAQQLHRVPPPICPIGWLPSSQSHCRSSGPHRQLVGGSTGGGPRGMARPGRASTAAARPAAAAGGRAASTAVRLLAGGSIGPGGRPRLRRPAAASHLPPCASTAGIRHARRPARLTHRVGPSKKAFITNLQQPAAAFVEKKGRSRAASLTRARGVGAHDMRAQQSCT